MSVSVHSTAHVLSLMECLFTDTVVLVSTNLLHDRIQTARLAYRLSVVRVPHRIPIQLLHRTKMALLLRYLLCVSICITSAYLCYRRATGIRVRQQRSTSFLLRLERILLVHNFRTVTLNVLFVFGDELVIVDHLFAWFPSQRTSDTISFLISMNFSTWCC